MLVYCKGRVPCAAWDTARGSRHVVLGSRPGVKILKGCRFPHLHRYRTPLDPIGAYGERQRNQPISQPKKSLDIALPNLDDINGAKAYQGAISGVLVGTGLSLGVSALKATFVAGVVAALVALLPAKSGEEVEEALQNEGAELPGVAAISLANQGKDALTGKTKLRPDVTATVATASVTAGALVAVFAAKSLGIALAGTLAFIAISKDNDLDISTATVEGRDYLRTRGYSGPGVAASLLLLQASTAAQKISEVVQNYARSTTSSASSRAGAYSPLQAVPSGAGLGSAAPLDSSSSVGSGGLLERSGRGGQGITSAGSSTPGPVSPSVMKASGTTDGEARASGGEAKVAEREAEAPASPLSGPSSPIGARPGNGAGIATGREKNVDATEPTPPPPEDEEDPAPAARKAGGNGAANGAPQGSGKGVDATEPKQPPPEEQDPTPPAAGAGLEGSGKDVDATEPQLPVEDENESAPPADGGPPKNAGQNVEATAPVTAPVTPVEASGDEDTKTGGSGGGGGSGKDSGLLVEARRNWEANAPSTPVLQDQGDGNLLTQALQHRAKSDNQNPLAEQSASKKEEAGDLLSAALKLRNLLNKPATITLPSPESKSEGLLEAARKLREQAIGPSKARLPPPGASPLDQVKQAKSAAAAPASTPAVSEPVKSSPLPSGDVGPQKAEESTPLESIKGESEEVEAEDLAPTPTEFKPKEDSTPLSTDTSSEKEAESTPLEDIKGKNQEAAAGDLAPTPTVFTPTEDSTPLSGETASDKQGDSTPLEDIKGKNEDAAAGELASTPTAFEPTEDSTPLSGDQASEKQDDSTPLEKMKGKNEDVAAGDLASTPTTFEPSEGSTPLSGDTPSQEEGDTTPLEKLKGKNEDAAAGLDSAPTTFKPTEGDTPLNGDEPIQKAEDSTPLESIKGKNDDVAAGDLVSTPTSFKPTEDSTLLSGETSSEKQGDSTPLENIKGKNEDVASGDLASTPTAFKPTEDSTPLSGGTPAQDPEESTYLDSIQAESDDEVDAIRLASNPLTFTPPEGAVLDRGDDAWKSGGRGSDSGVAKGSEKTPLENIKGKGTPLEPLLSSGAAFKPGFKERALSGGLGYDSSRASGGGEPRSGMLRAQQAQGIGRTLQLLSLLAPIQKPPQGPASSVSGGGKGTSAAAPTTPTPTPTPTPTATPSLGSTQDRQAAGPKQSNVLQVQTSGAGKVMSLLTFSTKAPGAATSAPFQPGKLATEQPPPQKPAPRSAARPIVSPALKVSSAPPGAARGVGLGGASVPSLTKASANVPTPPVTGYMGRAREADSTTQGPRRLTPQEQTKAAAVAGGGPPVPKKRTLVENLMLLAGSSAVGGMLALTWRMVRGFAATDPTNRALGAFLAICVVLLVILSNLRPKRPPTPSTA